MGKNQIVSNKIIFIKNNLIAISGLKDNGFIMALKILEIINDIELSKTNSYKPYDIYFIYIMYEICFSITSGFNKFGIASFSNLLNEVISNEIEVESGKTILKFILSNYSIAGVETETKEYDFNVLITMLLEAYDA